MYLIAEIKKRVGGRVWFPCNLCHLTIVIFCILFASTTISYRSSFNLKTTVGISLIPYYEIFPVKGQFHVTKNFVRFVLNFL
jgi:hypothetical protein